MSLSNLSLRCVPGRRFNGAQRPGLTLTKMIHKVYPMACRLVHESHLPAGTTEGILCSPDNALLEGLVSNIFVIKGVYH